MVKSFIGDSTSCVQPAFVIGRPDTVQLLCQPELRALFQRILVNGVCLLNFPFWNQIGDNLVHGLCRDAQPECLGKKLDINISFIRRAALNERTKPDTPYRRPMLFF